MVNKEFIARVIEVTPPSYRRRLWLVLFASVLLSLFDSAFVLSVGPMVNGVVNNTSPVIFGRAFDIATLLFFAGLVLLSKNLLFVAASWWKHSVLFSLQAHLSEGVLQRFLSVGRISNSIDPGKKASYVTNETLQLILNVHTPAISWVTEFSLVLFVSITLLLVNTVEAVLLFGTLIALIGVFQWKTKGWLRSSGERRQAADSRRHEIVRAVIDSETDIRAMGWFSRVGSLYAGPNRVSSSMVSNKAFATEIVKNVIELAVIAGVGLLVVASTAGSAAELVPTLAVFGAAAYRLAPSFNRMMVCSQSMRFGWSSLHVISEVLRDDPQSEVKGKDPENVASVRSLQVEVDVLSGPSGTTLLHNEKFSLRCGDIMVISGPSGIGKSTLLKALVDGSPGITISINGQAINGGLAGRGLAIGMLGQKPLVLPESLGYNILPVFVSAWGNDSSIQLGDMERSVIFALSDLHSASILDRGKITENLAHPISSSTLSGGQAQRVALMRALMMGTDILLLDEPTSALDAATRDRFFELLKSISASRITLIISHDAEIERIANHVLRLRAEK